jgi:hypothetical protein
MRLGLVAPVVAAEVALAEEDLEAAVSVDAEAALAGRAAVLVAAMAVFARAISVIAAPAIKSTECSRTPSAIPP